MSYLFILLLFLFFIFYTIDSKPIHILLDFIGIILTISIYILTYSNIDISFLSYFLIIIYGSALAILFGFIVMLYHYTKEYISPNIISQFNNINSNNFLLKLLPKKNNINLIFFIFLIFFLIILLNIKFENLNLIEIYNIKNISQLSIIELIFNNLYNSSSSIIYIFIIINILYLALIGIIYLFL